MVEEHNFIKELFIGFIRKNWIWYVIIMITMIGIPLQQLTIPKYYGTITQYIQNRTMGKAQSTLWVILGIWAIVSVLDIAKSYIIKTLWPKFSNYCREEMLRAVLTKYSHHYEAVKTGLIQSKINDVPWVLDASFNLVQKILFENIVLVFSTIIYLAYIDWKLTAIFTIGIIILAVISYDYIRRAVPYVQATETVYQNYFEEISEVLENIISIFTNNREEYNIHKIRTLIDTANHDYDSLRNLDTLYKAIYYSICIILFLGLLLVGLQLYKNNTINAPQLVSLFIISYTLLGSLMIFYYNSRDIITNKGAVDVINKWYNNLPREPVNRNARQDASQDTLDIDIRDLWFKYCSGIGGHIGYCSDNDGWIYSGLNMRLQEGENVMVRGHIGSGKSTFAKILVRLHSLDSENSKGHVFFGSSDINDLDPQWIRRVVTYTPQKTTLFNDTLWNNIKYGLHNSNNNGGDDGRKKVTPQLILDTLRESNLDNVADKFSQMMHKPVGKRGSHLSGGQQQIVWLLRAMFNDSRWVVLDEPTNNLDPQSIINVKKIIRKLQQSGKTTIIITHDESISDLATRHIVFINGQIGSDTKTN